MKLWLYMGSYFLAAAVLTYYLTPVVRELALRWGAMDVPSGRKSHERAVPTMGGLAMFFAFFTVLSFAVLGHALWFRHSPFLQFRLDHLFFGALPLTLIGILDDKRRINYKWKLAVQILTGLLMLRFGYRISGVTNPFTGETIALGFLSGPLTVLWFLFIINAINFMDGVDGLAAGVSLIALMTLFAVSLYLHNLQIALLSAILAGAIVGFFRYNFYPASVFMGDTGSLFLGFLIAFISLCGAQKSSTAVALAVPVVILGLPILDAIFAVARRWSSEWTHAKSFSERVFSWRRIFYPDLGHIHHRLLALGLTKPQAVVFLYLVALGFGLTGFALTAARYYQIALILLYMAVVFFIAFRKFPVTGQSLGVFEAPAPPGRPVFEQKRETSLWQGRKWTRFNRLIAWTAGVLLPIFIFAVFLAGKVFWK